MKVTNVWSELKIIKNGIETTVSVPVSIQLNGTERVYYCKSDTKPLETSDDKSKYNFMEYSENKNKTTLSPDGSKIWVRTTSGTVDLSVFDGIESAEGAVSQSYIEQNVKLGKQWELSNRFTAIPANGIVGLKFTTGSKPVLMKGSSITTDAQSFVTRTLKGATATNGATIQIFNLNDDLNPLTTLSTANIVTGITGGTDCFTPIFQKISSGGSSGTSVVRIGNTIMPGLEKVLKADTTYYFTFQNLGVEAAEVCFYGTFYEGDYYA